MELGASIAAQGYASARPVTAPVEGHSRASTAAGAAATDFVQTLTKGEETAKAAMTGGADAHALVQALAETELAIETAVTLRDRVVEAYQEILRMPV